MRVVEQSYLLGQRKVAQTGQVREHGIDLRVAGPRHAGAVKSRFILTVHQTTLQPAGPLLCTDRSWDYRRGRPIWSTVHPQVTAVGW